MIRAWLFRLAIGLGLSTSLTAAAYDIDTHFYNTYLMARMTGIRHEVALKLATYNEWIDQSWITSPMDPIPGFGERKRRLYHFTQEKINRYRNNGSKARPFFGQHLNYFGLSQENNELASELISFGLKTGNFALVGGGLHVLMDSWGHSQFSYMLGHAEFGHWPDRPWFYPEKHRHMTQVLFQALTTIRALLPAEALDSSLTAADGRPFAQLSPNELWQIYDTDAAIQGLIHWDPFTDPRFTKPAMEYLYRIGAQRGIFQAGYPYEDLLKNEALFTPGQDVRTILKSQLTLLFQMPPEQRDQIINLDIIFKDYLRGLTLTKHELSQMAPERMDFFINRIVYEATIHQVAGVLNKEKLVDFEADGSLRRLEMYLRLSQWRKLIQDKTGRRVAFRHDRFKVEKLIKKENAVDRDPLDSLIDQVEAKEMEGTEEVSLTRREQFDWYMSIMKYDQWNLAAWALARLSHGLLLNKEDYGRWRASRGNLLYQDEKFSRLLTNKNGVLGARPYKDLLTAEQVAKMEAEHRTRLCEQSLTGD